VKKVLVLGRNSRSTRLLLSVLVKEGYNTFFIEECRDDKKHLLNRRIRKFGMFTVFSQLLFMFFVRLQAKQQKVAMRLAEIESTVVHTLANVTPVNTFTNVNDSESIATIKDIAPEYIFLSGTRILSANLLNQIQCPVINIHAGINPAYRGVHGGYWALVSQQPELFGSTIHFVDEGVDTGSVLSHAMVKPCVMDNFSTYPLLQMSAALKCLPAVLTNLSNGKQHTFVPELPSKIWTHPTIWQYIVYRLNNGIK
jgi:folate-dependent phosphoribosylglycinamide formyltransferase PurN